MQRRTECRSLSRTHRCIFLVAAVLTMGSMFLPWIEIHLGANLWGLPTALSAFGAEMPSRVCSGLEIPRLAQATSTDPLWRLGAVAGELSSGTLDRAFARAVFGERYEERHVWAVFVPAALALFGVVMLFGRGSVSAILIRATAILALLTAAALTWVTYRVTVDTGASEVVLRSGWVLTVVGLFGVGASGVGGGRKG